MFEYDLLIIKKMIAEAKQRGEAISSLPLVIYARKSTKDVTNVSLKTQVDVCQRALLGCKEVKTIQIYQEDSKSGYFIDGRNDFLEILERVKKGEIKVVMAYSIDRITRNVADCETIDRIFREAGARYFLATQCFEDTPMHRLVKRELISLAQFEPEYTSEKACENMWSNAMERKFNGGRVPYGFKVLESRYVIDENESVAVQMMFSLFASGKNCLEISNELFSKGYTSRGSNTPIPQQTIYNILRNERYAGTYIWAESGKKKRKHRVSTKNIEEVRIANGIPQIVDATTFAKVRMMMNSIHKSNKAKVPYVLTGKLKCGCCGKFLHGAASFNKSHKRYTFYRCGSAANCGTTIRQEYIERATAELLCVVLESIWADTKSSKVSLNSLRNKSELELASLTQKRVHTKNKLAELALSLSRANNDEVIELVNGQIQETNSLLKELDHRIAELKMCSKSFGNFIKKVKLGEVKITPDDILSDTSVFEELVNLFVVDITINKETVVFNLVDIVQ